MASSVAFKRFRLLIAVVAALTVALVRQQTSQMSDWFFQPSWQGAKGLALYSLGDLNGAAEAYRAHFHTEYVKGRAEEDSAAAALLGGDFKKAKASAQATLADHPDDIDALLTLGEVALEEGRFAETQDQVNLVLKQKTDQADALVLASLASAGSDDYDGAIRSLNLTLRHGRLGSRLSAFLKFLKTTGDLEDRPRDQRPLALLANYYRYLRIYDDANGRVAISYAERAIAAGDRLDEAYTAMGVVHAKQDRPDQALEALLKAVERNPKHAEAQRWAYTIYSSRGDLLNAYAMARAAYESAPDDVFYVSNLNVVMVNRMGNFQEGETVLKQAVERHPNDASTLWSLGYVYSILERYPESVDCFQRAIRAEPKNPVFYEQLGHVLGRMGRKTEAVAAYQQAISVDPFRHQSHTALAAYYWKQFRYREAMEEYQAAFRLGERNPEHQVNMCIAYHILGDFQHAVDCMQAVLAKDPRNHRAAQLLPEIKHNLDLQRAK